MFSEDILLDAAIRCALDPYLCRGRCRDSKHIRNVQVCSLYQRGRLGSYRQSAILLVSGQLHATGPDSPQFEKMLNLPARPVGFL